MDMYRKVRLACAEGMSQREAARHFNISRDSVAKMMAFSVPPGYRRTAPVKRPKLDGFTEIIDGWLEALPNLELVGTFRHPLVVARSLKRRHGNDTPRMWLEVWLAYNEVLLRLAEERGFPLIDFDLPAEAYAARLLGDSNARCELDLDPDLAPVELDEGQIGQVVAIVIVVLWIEFRIWRGALFPLVGVGMTIAMTLGLMGFTEFKLTTMMVLTPMLLLAIGIVMVGSASIAIAEEHGAPTYYYLVRHLVFIAIGVFLASSLRVIPMAFLQRISQPLALLSILMLALVLVPGLGHTVNGSTRWVRLGFTNFQMIEAVKLMVIIYMAGYLARKAERVQTRFFDTFKPLAFAGLLSFLLLLQPDMGTTIVLLATAFGMLFLGGVPWRQFAVLIAIAAVSLGTLVWLTPWRMQRVTSFMDPFADPLDSGYQLSNALIALGRGEWFGVGLGESVQKLYYLPEAHNDFLLSVIGEELGFAGVTLIILLFTFIVWRAMRIGVLAEGGENRFAVYTAYGCALWLGFQSFVNIGVNLGMMPTKGLTLPFMSYGGNSIIVGMLAIAMLQRIHLEYAPGKPREGAIWRTSS